MNPTGFFLQQQSKRYVNALTGAINQVSYVREVEQISAIANTPSGPVYLAHANPEIKRLKLKLNQVAKARVQLFYDADPTYKMAYRCWESSRGWAPDLANQFYQIFQQKRSEHNSPVKPVKADEETSSGFHP